MPTPESEVRWTFERVPELPPSRLPLLTSSKQHTGTREASKMSSAQGLSSLSKSKDTMFRYFTAMLQLPKPRGDMRIFSPPKPTRAGE